MEKFKKYEDEYTRRLMAKYFSKKNLYGGNIFDENMKIDEEIIKSSRWPCTRSYADPVKAFEDHSSSNNSTTIVENPFNNSNGKNLPEKNVRARLDLGHATPTLEAKLEKLRNAHKTDVEVARKEALEQTKSLLDKQGLVWWFVKPRTIVDALLHELKSLTEEKNAQHEQLEFFHVEACNRLDYIKQIKPRLIFLEAEVQNSGELVETKYDEGLDIGLAVVINALDQEYPKWGVRDKLDRFQ